MKLITSLVRPHKLDDVKDALNRVRVYSLSVAEIRDHAPQRHDTMVWMGREYSNGFSMKLQIDVVVHDDDVDEVVCTILKTARTGQQGDGYVLVTPVEHRYIIESGLRDIS